MKLALLAGIDNTTLILMALAALVGIAIYRMEKLHKQHRSNDVCEQYATLTEADIAAIPDGELVRAVAANLIAKQEKDGVELSRLLPLLSPGQRGVYGGWLLCNELSVRDLGAYFRSPYRRFAPMAQEGFAMVGAVQCAAVMQEACERFERQKNGEKGLAPWAEITARLQQAVQQEQPLSLFEKYIRDTPAEFADQSAT